jgi:cytochrome c553
MTASAILDLKQKLSKLSGRDRQEIAAYLLRLKHEAPEWKREVSRRMREMDRGKKIRLGDVLKRVGHA